MMNDVYQNDMRARTKALDVNQSFIVQAPAGSGKTELLIQRYLKLLSVANHPEEILSITFTKKAANEMRSRVLQALIRGTDTQPPEADHAKKTWDLSRNALKRDKQFNWRLIENPNQIRIQTIDSLCSFLTKQLPMLSNFGSQPEITDSPTTLYQHAVREVLTHLESNYQWSESIGILLNHLDNDMNKLYELLVHLLSKRDQWLQYIYFDKHPDDTRMDIETTIQQIIDTKLLATSQLLDSTQKSELLSLIHHAALNLHEDSIDSIITTFTNNTCFPPPSHTHLEHWKAICAFLLSKSGNNYTWRKKATNSIGFKTLKSASNKLEEKTLRELNQRFESLLTSIQCDDLKNLLIDINALPPGNYTDEQWTVMCAMINALKVTSAQLRVVFQQYGKIDFVENAQAALLSLGRDDDPTDLALSLDHQIKHILIDEFQDTSTSQYLLLEKLTTGWTGDDGRSLFIVGDPMQSIYRFREAEVGLFLKIWQSGIGHLNLEPLSLAINFRSDTSIVNWNNRIFSNMFPLENDITNGAVKFSSSITLTDSSSFTNNIHIKGFTEGCSQSRKLVNDIIDHQRLHPNDKVCILVRSRSHLVDTLTLLKSNDIPYKAVDINPLNSRQHILDIQALTSAMLHLGDRISWLSILRAPWLGLTLNDLHILCNTHPNKLIWEIVTDQDITCNLMPETQQRLQSFVEILHHQLQHRDRSHIRDWIERTWQLIGGPATLGSDADLLDIEEYFKLLEQTDPLNAETLNHKISKHYASSEHTTDQLQIMTIHSAKGLEFDAVFMPGLEKQPTQDSKQLLLWMDHPIQDTTAPLLAPITLTGSRTDDIYNYITRQQVRRMNYEGDRLFYVGTTRAKNHLYLYFNAVEKKDGTYSARSGSLLEKLLPQLHEDEFIIHHATASQREPVNNITQSQRLVSNWENPLPLSLSNTSNHRKLHGIYFTHETAKITGTALHRILQLISNKGLLWWSNIDPDKQESIIQKMLIHYGIVKNDHNNATMQIKLMLQNTLNDEIGKWILSNNHQGVTELQLITQNNHEFDKLIIDKTFVDEKGNRWIIDYKTSVNCDQSVADFLESEAAKYKDIMMKYANTLCNVFHEEIFTGLYFPAIPAWKVLKSPNAATVT